MVSSLKRLAVLLLLPAGLFAQDQGSSVQRADGADSTEGARDTAPLPHRESYWRHFAAGFVSSLLLHETGHVLTAYAIGGHPYFGLDKGRPTVYSGIDSKIDPHKQFLFSSAGLNVQALLDEGVLDVPHRRGSAFERGLLAGGIATAYFYATIGRNASVSDITFIARTSSLSKTQASLIYAGLATIHAFRISLDDHYAHFFVSPHGAAGTGGSRGGKADKQGVNVGVAVLPR